MDEKIKVSKVNPDLFRSKIKPKRADQIQELKDLFRLTFRVDFDYHDQLESPEDEVWFYDLRGEFFTETSGFSADIDGEEMAEFADEFKKLRAQKVFKTLCVEYYTDRLAHLKTTALRYTRELTSGRVDEDHPRYQEVMTHLDCNRRDQDLTMAKLRELAAQDQIQALSMELDPDKRVAFLTKKLKKMVLDTAVTSDELAAVEQEVLDLGTQNDLEKVYLEI